MLALAGTSDLVKGVYEGGLKTWECALDLVAYLAEQKDSFDGKRVLEVGTLFRRTCETMTAPFQYIQCDI